MGLYRQRAGALHVVTAPGSLAKNTTERIASQLSILTRSELSSPPIYGAKITAIVLNDAKLFEEWQDDLRTMSGRIIKMRKSLKEELDRLMSYAMYNSIEIEL